jgi:hypothetical protein
MSSVGAVPVRPIDSPPTGTQVPGRRSSAKPREHLFRARTVVLGGVLFLVTVLVPRSNVYGQYVFAPVVALIIVEAKYKQLIPIRQSTSRVARGIGGKSIAPDPSGDEAPSHEANVKTPGGSRAFLQMNAKKCAS